VISLVPFDKQAEYEVKTTPIHVINVLCDFCVFAVNIYEKGTES
jgi:hypothetical protein